MSSDRGTLPRGTASDWQQPTAPAGRRPPRAPRERKPVLAVLAVVLIVGGALAAGYLVTKDAKTVAAIEISQHVSAGQRIPLSAMQEVQVSANSTVNYVPWNEEAQVTQFYAYAAIPPGTLLNAAMVVKSSALAGRKDVLGLALKAGQLPNGLQVGDHVDIYVVSDSKTQCPGVPGGMLDNDAAVLAISVPAADSGNSGTDFVEIAATPARAGAIACNASNGIVGLAVLPPGSTGAEATAPPSAQQRGTVQPRTGARSQTPAASGGPGSSPSNQVG